MDFQKILSLAKIILPSNSKLLNAAEKAAEVCKGYGNTEDDLKKVITDLNIAPATINRAISVLNSNSFASKLNTIAPGLCDQMRKAVSNIAGASDQGGVGLPSSSTDDLTSLKDRLNKL